MERLRLHASPHGCRQCRYAIENHIRERWMRRRRLSSAHNSALHRRGEQLSGDHFLWRRMAEFADEDGEEYVAL